MAELEQEIDQIVQQGTGILESAQDDAAIDEVNDMVNAAPEVVEPSDPSRIADVIMEGVAGVTEVEGVQVAGLKDVVVGIAKGLGKRATEAEKRVFPPLPDEPVQKIGSRLIIREADVDEAAVINETLGNTGGINFVAIADSIEDYDLANHIDALKQNNAELFAQAKRGTINYEQIVKLAEQEGMEDMVIEWVSRAPGSGDTAEKVLAGIVAAMNLSRETKAAWEAAKALPMGAGRDAALTKAKQLMALEANIYANLSGAGSEAGRTLYMLREAQKTGIPNFSERADELIKIFGADNADDVEYIGDLYLSIPTERGRKNFIKNGIGKKIDQAIEIWINSILTHPTTHMINVVGNSSFAALRVLENGLAAGIGAARNAAKIGSPDRIRARAVVAQLNAMRQSLLDAMLVGGKTLLTEEPGRDIVSKIDVRNRRAIGTTGDPREIMNQIRSGQMWPAAVNTFGVVSRLGGRFLLAEDEFFKAIGYRAKLEFDIETQALDLYDSAIVAGKTPEEAAVAYAAEKARLLANPPVGMVNDANKAARAGTFQDDLDGLLGDFQAPMSHPLMKLFVPFYKTPMNIIGEVMKRTPMAFMSSKFRDRIRAGGRDADLAMAELATGSAVISSFAYMSMGVDTPNNDVIIMGSGPSDPKARQAMGRIGLQPFSINLRQDDGTYKSITYDRFDPISGLLAIGADFAYYAQYETDQGVLDNLAMAAVMSVAEYMKQMPLLEGVQQLSAAISNPDPKTRTEQLMELLGAKTTGAALSVLPGQSSFAAGIERIQDPTSYSTLLPAEGMFGEDPTQLPAFMRGFYTELQRAKGRNPLFNGELEPRLNMWGETVTVGTGAGWEFVSPIRVKDTKHSVVDQELMDLGLGVSMPSKKISGVLLNATQYNQFIRFMNDMDARGKLPGMSGYNKNTVLINQLSALVTSKEYQAIELKEDKLDFVNNVISSYKSAARQMLISGDPSLKLKIEEMKQ